MLWKRVPTTRSVKLLALMAVMVTVGLPATAQYTSPTALGARSGALGGSLFYSPGETAATVDYRRGFMLGALSDKTVRLQLAAGPRGMALAAWSHRGNAVWHEQQLALGYGLQVTEWLHVAVGARGLFRGTDDAHYENLLWLAPSALLQASLSSTTLTLLAGTRPWDDAHPWQMHLQATYRPLPHWLTLVELEREERTRLRLGMEYVYDNCWFLRAGMATRPTLLTFGLGTRQRHYSIDLAVEVHNSLGVTPQTSLSLWF